MGEKKKAMVVAVSKYDNEQVQDLPFCENDGESMHSTLKSLGYEIAEKNVLIGKINGIQMKDAIYDFFNDRTIRSKDTVLFYYSGHGMPDIDTVYLSSSDIDPEEPGKRGFSFEELRKMVNKCISTKIVAVLDSCYSGSEELGKGTQDKIVQATKLIRKGAAIQGEGKCILSASQSSQQAFPTQEGEQSVYTHFILQGLAGKDKDAVDPNGNVTIDTLSKYAYDKVTNIYQNQQKPEKYGKVSGDIILATFPELVEELSGQPRLNVKAALNEANTSFSIGNYAQANSQYNSILQNDPQNIQAWINKGNALENMIMYDEAIRCFNRAIEIDSSDYVAWYNKGNVLARQNRYVDALRCYETAIQLNSKDPSCWKNKAYVLSKLGRISEAKQCLEHIKAWQ